MVQLCKSIKMVNRKIKVSKPAKLLGLSINTNFKEIIMGTYSALHGT